MLSLLDLPNELLTEVLDIGNMLDQQSGVNLCLVCTHFCHIVQPLLWRKIFIDDSRKLSLLHRSLRKTPELGRFVRVLRLLYDSEEISEGLSIGNVLSSILRTMTTLNNLYLQTILMGHRIYPWSLNLASPDALVKLSLDGFSYDPAMMDQIFKLKNLRILRLGRGVNEETWDEQAPTTKSLLFKLDLFSRYYRIEESRVVDATCLPPKVYRGLFSCLIDLQELRIGVIPKLFETGDFDQVLSDLGQRCRLRVLELVVSDIEEGRDHKLGVDFSTWKYLEHLKIDSIALWPDEHSWEIRQEFYKRLPASLEHLVISFPFCTGEPTMDDTLDGVFQSNPWHMRSSPWFSIQKVRESRFTWFINFLSSQGTDRGPKPYLPRLRSIELKETGDYRTGRDPDSLATRPYSLPDSIAEQFAARGIDVRILVRDHPAFSPVEEYDSDEDTVLEE